MIKLITLIVLVSVILFLLKVSSTDYDRCYSSMENTGHSIFGCCNGVPNNNTCHSCPYFVNQIRGKK